MNNTVILAYSGGLDTSIIAKWLQIEKNLDVIAMIADVGQNEDLEKARQKALDLGVQEAVVIHLQREFAEDFVFPMFRANAVYEGNYLLGTAIARPLIARHLVLEAQKRNAKFVAHGATGKGNDQLRFELAIAALDPDLEIIAPWREWDFQGREDLIQYAREHSIPIPMGKENASPFSMDENLLHTSYEGTVLENPAVPHDPQIWQRTLDPKDAPSKSRSIVLGFQNGDPCSINSRAGPPEGILDRLNQIGDLYGIGRLDLVENRAIGMKSRGLYETPGGTILLAGHRAIEQITLDPGAAHLKDELMPKYAKLIYDGYWYSPEREMLQQAIDYSQRHVTGTVQMQINPGSVQIIARESPMSLHSPENASFDEMGSYDRTDATGYIRLKSLRLRTLAQQQKIHRKNSQ